jgi:hypothetical protein
LTTSLKYLGRFALTNSFFLLCCLVCAASELTELQVPRVIRVESGRETGLPLNIAVSNALYPQTMVVIRGIPSSVSLTEGRLFPSGVWALKVSAAGSARFVTASNSQEDTPLIVSLVTLEGANLGNATTQLVIAPAAPVATENAAMSWTPRLDAMPETTGAIPAPEKPARPAAPAEKEPVRVLYPSDIEKILKLMERGDQHLLEGKIPSARRFYQLATEMGWPEGALAIARTYDADHLRRFPILGGIVPDEALAHDWYSRARELSLRVQMRDRQFSGAQ